MVVVTVMMVVVVKNLLIKTMVIFFFKTSLIQIEFYFLHFWGKPKLNTNQIFFVEKSSPEVNVLLLSRSAISSFDQLFLAPCYATAFHMAHCYL